MCALTESGFPSAELLGAVRLVRARMAADGDYISGHETRTRQYLIDPVLTALGWDVLDPGLVVLEASAQTGWSDYALRPQSDVALVVEAKRFGSRLDGYPIQQAVRYARWFGSREAVVTDGDLWHFVKVGGFVQERIATLIRVRISVSDDRNAAVGLSHMARDRLAQV